MEYWRGAVALTVKVTSRDGVVVVESSGEYTRQEHRERSDKFRRMIMEKWTDRSQPLRVLFDLRRVTGEFTRSGGYFHITREWGDNNNKRIAWLYSDPANEPQFNYRETIARQHGYIARAFRNADEAMRWLTNPGAK